LPFVVCGLLMLLEVAALRLWRLGFNTGRFVRSRTLTSFNVEISAVNDTSKNHLL
jgi:hypothetical protein